VQSRRRRASVKGETRRRAQEERAQREWTGESTVTRSANASTPVRLTRNCGAPACKRGREREGLHSTTGRPESGGTSMGASSTGTSPIDPAASTIGNLRRRRAQARYVRARVGFNVGSKVGDSVGCSVGRRVGANVVFTGGDSVFSVGASDRLNVRDSVGTTIERRRDGRMERRSRCRTDVGTVSDCRSSGRVQRRRQRRREGTDAESDDEEAAPRRRPPRKRRGAPDDGSSNDSGGGESGGYHREQARRRRAPPPGLSHSASGSASASPSS
jgi:hypothetical protein